MLKEMALIPNLSGKSGGLLPPSPLRTVCAIFTAHGSSTLNTFEERSSPYIVLMDLNMAYWMEDN